MSVQLNPYIEQLSWAEARELILPVNPDFVRHADELELPKECCIFKVRYRYGDYLSKNGQLALRDDSGQNVPLTNGSFPEILREKLSYASSVPMGICLNKKIEIFLQKSDQIVPIVAANPGYIFALVGALSNPELAIDQGDFWNLTAGIRSVFSIAKISEEKRHRRVVDEFGVDLLAPKSHMDHWDVFRGLMRSERLVDDWEAHVLYFSKEWLEKRKTIAWLEFRDFLLTYVWDNTNHLRNTYLRDFILSKLESDANIKTDPNNINTLRQVISIAGSFAPGLAFEKDEKAFPHNLLKTIYRDLYEIEYAMLFMGLSKFNPAANSVYYSISQPMITDHYPDGSPFKSKLDELRDLGRSLRRVVMAIKEENTGIREMQKSILRGVNVADFQIYHTHHTEDLFILNSTEILRKDDALIGVSPSDFSSNSVLLRGLIGIHPLKMG